MDTTRRDTLRLGLALGLLAPLAGCGDQEPTGQQRTRLVSSGVRRGLGDPAQVPAVVAGLHGLGAGLFGALPHDDNLCVSPLSISACLAMVATGARGTTLEEMLHVLGAADVRDLDAGTNALTRELEGLANRKVLLDVANALFGARGYAWQDDFLRALAKDFGAGVTEVDFGSPEAAAAAINGWTSRQTHGRITEIVPADALDALTRMVLVDAVYFKAPWATRFDADQTAPEDFHLPDGSVVKVPMMHDTIEAAGRGLGDGWTAVRLPYLGGKLAMTVVLPDEGRDADLLAAIEDGHLPSIVASTEAGEVDLSLPRWELRSSYTLNDVLAELGMPTVFDPVRADLSGMTTTEQVFLDFVLHKTYVAVDEEGTEAAAVTAGGVDAMSMQIAPPVVVDRPFVYVIHDVEHGTPIFLGRVVDPRG